MVKSLLTVVAPLLLATKVAAFGCDHHTYGACADNIVHWYDPDDGQICDPLDCGGGRAPPKYNVPGCPAYTGTSTLNTQPSYMPCFKALATGGVASSTVDNPKPTGESSTSESQATVEQTSTIPGISVSTSISVSVAPSTTGSHGTPTNGDTTVAAPTTTLPATLSTVTQPGPGVNGNQTGGAVIATTSTHSGAAGKLGQGPLLTLIGAALGVFALL